MLMELFGVLFGIPDYVNLYICPCLSYILLNLVMKSYISSVVSLTFSISISCEGLVSFLDFLTDLAN